MKSSVRERIQDDFRGAYLLKGARMRPPGRRWRGQCFRFRTRTPYADGDEVRNRRKHFSWNTSPKNDTVKSSRLESLAYKGHYFFCLGCCKEESWVDLSLGGNLELGESPPRRRSHSTDFTHNMVRHNRASAAKQRMRRQSASERDDDITFVVVVGSGLEWFQITSSEESTQIKEGNA